jgi:hypothetical protein
VITPKDNVRVDLLLMLRWSSPLDFRPWWHSCGACCGDHLLPICLCHTIDLSPIHRSHRVALMSPRRIFSMNLRQVFSFHFASLVSVALLSLGALLAALPAQADTVKARCDVFPKGEDRATSSGLCTFSQRQGFVSIQLKNGQRIELSPHGDKPNTYLDANGKPATREFEDSGKIHIYRLAKQSIFVYWDTTPYK